MVRGNHPWSMFRELEEAFFNPVKYGSGRTLAAGTKDKPAIIERGEWVTRKFKAWQEEDGSYHEELMDGTEDIINPGGTG